MRACPLGACLLATCELVIEVRGNWVASVRGVVTPLSFFSHPDKRCMGPPQSDQSVFRKEAGDSGTFCCSYSLLRLFL